MVLLALLGACAALEATEQSQLSYQGKGPNPCLFGGVTAEADLHCQELYRGLQGALVALNTQVIKELSEGAVPPSCQLHVAKVRSALWQRSDLEVRSVFSCPAGLNGCHVSALVMVKGGRVYVLDNGTILKPNAHPGSVSRFGDYYEAVNGKYWFHPPVQQAGEGTAASRKTALHSPEMAPEASPSRAGIRRR